MNNIFYFPKVLSGEPHLQHLTMNLCFSQSPREQSASLLSWQVNRSGWYPSRASEQTGEVVMEGVVAQILGVKLAEHCGRVKSFGLAVQVLRGKVKSQEGRERREGIEVQVSTGYWLPQQKGCPWPCSRNHCEGVGPKPRSLGPLLDS